MAGIVLASDAVFAVAVWRNVIIHVWRGASSLDRLRLVRLHEGRLVERYPEGIGSLVIAEGGAFAGSFGGPEREEAMAIAKAYGPHVVASAYIVEASGFRAAAARAIFAGVHLLIRRGSASKIFDSVPEGARFVAGIVAKGTPLADGAELLAAIEEARRTMGPPRAAAK
jgi:hypothetical protein